MKRAGQPSPQQQLAGDDAASCAASYGVVGVVPPRATPALEASVASAAPLLAEAELQRLQQLLLAVSSSPATAASQRGGGLVRPASLRAGAGGPSDGMNLPPLERRQTQRHTRTGGGETLNTVVQSVSRDGGGARRPQPTSRSTEGRVGDNGALLHAARHLLLQVYRRQEAEETAATRWPPSTAGPFARSRARLLGSSLGVRSGDAPSEETTACCAAKGAARRAPSTEGLHAAPCRSPMNARANSPARTPGTQGGLRGPQSRFLGRRVQTGAMSAAARVEDLPWHAMLDADCVTQPKAAPGAGKRPPSQTPPQDSAATASSPRRVFGGVSGQGGTTDCNAKQPPDSGKEETDAGPAPPPNTPPPEERRPASLDGRQSEGSVLLPRSRRVPAPSPTWLPPSGVSLQDSPRAERRCSPSLPVAAERDPREARQAVVAEEDGGEERSDAESEESPPLSQEAASAIEEIPPLSASELLRAPVVPLRVEAMHALEALSLLHSRQRTQKFYCPLCAASAQPPDVYSKNYRHYLQAHWLGRRPLGGFVCFPCRLRHCPKHGLEPSEASPLSEAAQLVVADSASAGVTTAEMRGLRSRRPALRGEGFSASAAESGLRRGLGEGEGDCRSSQEGLCLCREGAAGRASSKAFHFHCPLCDFQAEAFALVEAHCLRLHKETAADPSYTRAARRLRTPFVDASRDYFVELRTESSPDQDAETRPATPAASSTAEKNGKPGGAVSSSLKRETATPRRSAVASPSSLHPTEAAAVPAARKQSSFKDSAVYGASGLGLASGSQREDARKAARRKVSFACQVRVRPLDMELCTVEKLGAVIGPVFGPCGEASQSTNEDRAEDAGVHTAATSLAAAASLRERRLLRTDKSAPAPSPVVPSEEGPSVFLSEPRPRPSEAVDGKALSVPGTSDSESASASTARRSRQPKTEHPSNDPAEEASSRARRAPTPSASFFVKDDVDAAGVPSPSVVQTELGPAPPSPVAERPAQKPRREGGEQSEEAGGLSARARRRRAESRLSARSGNLAGASSAGEGVCLPTNKRVKKTFQEAAPSKAARDKKGASSWPPAAVPSPSVRPTAAAGLSGGCLRGRDTQAGDRTAASTLREEDLEDLDDIEVILVSGEEESEEEAAANPPPPPQRQALLRPSPPRLPSLIDATLAMRLKVQEKVPAAEGGKGGAASTAATSQGKAAAALQEKTALADA